MRKLTYSLTIAVFLCRTVLGQSPQIGASQMSQEDLQKYVPILPSVKARFWHVDPKLGYGVKNVGGGVYVISDQGWQSAFLVTDEGVIVFDAPESFGKGIPSAIKKVTDKPVRILVYSHAHKDHIGGAATFNDIKGLRIVATEGVAELLKEQNDPNRLIPNEVFGAQKTISLGGKTVELTRTFTIRQKVIYSFTFRKPSL